MSDTSQGPGWWQASDGKWYPPEQAAPAAAPTAPPGPGAGGPPGPAFGAAGQAPAYGGPGGAPGGAPGQLIEWPQRVLATLIDTGVILVGYIVLFILTAIFSAISDPLALIVFVVGYLFVVGASFYFAYLTGVNGQSPGKKVIGIKVIGEQTGQPIGGGMGIVRGLAHIADSFCLIGYLFPLWDPKKQTFADKIMSTVVVPGPKESFGPDVFKA